MIEFKNSRTALHRDAVSANAQFFADRWIMAESLGHKLKVCEIGVAWGDFSKHLIDVTACDEFFAVDLFELHKVEEVWGVKTTETLGGTTHLAYYTEEMLRHTRERCVMHFLSGHSYKLVTRLPDAYCDLIYIDGAHDFESVARDVSAYFQKLKQGGILMFNDYTLRDPIGAESYGVVPVVNQLANHGYCSVIGFAMQEDFFCDIALQKL